jgi:rubredoxin
MARKDPDERRAFHAEYMRMRYQTDPAHRAKHIARVKVTKAVKRGRLVKLSCEKCGSAKSQAHHPDYSRPLDVQWLCRDCHAEKHGGHGFHN